MKHYSLMHSLFVRPLIVSCLCFGLWSAPTASPDHIANLILSGKPTMGSKIESATFVENLKKETNGSWRQFEFVQERLLNFNL